jgi:hypothetical protein
MRTFKDNAGRSWVVVINVDTIRRVRALVQVDLLKVLDGELVQKLAGDPVLLCDVLYAVLKPEADAQNISDVDFGRAMAGDAIEHATQAFLDAIADFFPPGKRNVLAKMLGKLRVLETKSTALAEKNLDGVDLDQVLADALSRAGASSGDSPASWVLTRAI